jgi:TonB family protein
MKTLASSIAAVLFLRIVLTAQVSGASPEPPRYDRGVIANGTYTNDCLGFSLPLPEGWETRDIGTKAPGIAIHLGDTLSLLVLNRPSGSAFGESIALQAFDTSSSPAATAEQFITQSAQRLISHDPQNRESTRAAYTVDYGGKHFSRLDSKQTLSNGGTRYFGYAYTKFRGYLIGETLTAASPEALDESANMLQKITFHEDQRNPACVPGTNDGLKPGVSVGVVGSVSSGSVKPGQRIRVSRAVSIGLLIQKVEPQYPEAARKAHIEGTVILDTLIDEKGNVETATLVSGDPTLVSAAIEAAKQWKYKPYLLNGTLVKMETQITIDFKQPGN